MEITFNFIDYKIAYRLKPIDRCGYFVNFEIWTGKNKLCNAHIQKNYIFNFFIGGHWNK